MSASNSLLDQLSNIWSGSDLVALKQIRNLIQKYGFCSINKSDEQGDTAINSVAGRDFLEFLTESKGLNRISTNPDLNSNWGLYSSVLAGIINTVLDDFPQTVFRLLKTKPALGKVLDTWVGQGVTGANELVSLLLEKIERDEPTKGCNTKTALQGIDF